MISHVVVVRHVRGLLSAVDPMDSLSNFLLYILRRPEF